MPVNEQAVDSVTIANVKTIAEFPAGMANLMLSNAVANQNNQFMQANAAVAKASEMLIITDVSESAGLASIIQMLTKTAQTTPPATA